MPIASRLELRQLAHTGNAIAVAECEKLKQVVSLWCALQVDYQASMPLGDISINARDSAKPLEEGPLVILVKENDSCVHIRQRQERLARLRAHY